MSSSSSSSSVALILMSVFLLLLIASGRPLYAPPPKTADVRHYGAVGDGHNDDTHAFLRAWEAICSSSSSSATLVVPSGTTPMVRQLFFQGPCKPDRINVEINGDIVAPQDPSSWNCKNGCEEWIHFKNVDHLSVYGTGKIHGRGETWWHKKLTKPGAFLITNSNNVSVSGLTFYNNPRMHFILRQVNTAHVSNITIDAPGNSPNTDGIHISGSTGITVDRCNIGTGDDCISIVGDSSDIDISNIVCGPGHGISIGSLGKHGATDRVENIHVRDVVLRGSTNGVRIKSWQGGHGYARNIIFERILSQGSDNVIIIDQFYCDHEQCSNNLDSAVKISNVTYREILGAPMKKRVGVVLDCSAAVACDDITLENIDLRSSDGSHAAFKMNNVFGKVLGQVIPRIPLNN